MSNVSSLLWRSHHYQLLPCRGDTLRKCTGRAEKCRKPWGFRRQLRVHMGKRLRHCLHLVEQHRLCPWHPGGGGNDNLSLHNGTTAQSYTLLTKGPSERSYLLKSTSTTNHSYDIITHMSSLMRISNFLEKLYSQMSQGLDVQITFEEENVNFTHTDKHQKL